MDGAEDSAVTPRREAQGRLSDAHREMLQAQEAAAAAAGDHTARARHLARLAELKAAHVAESRVFYEVLRRRMASHGIRFIVSLAQGKHQAMAELRASGGGVSASAGGDGLVVAGPLPGGGAISWLSLDLRCEPRFVLDGSRAELAPGGAWSEMHRMLYALCQPTDYFGGIPGMGPEKCVGCACRQQWGLSRPAAGTGSGPAQPRQAPDNLDSRHPLVGRAMQMAAACTLPDGARFIEEVVPWAREYCQEQGWSTPPLATWQAGAAACLEGYWCAPVLVPQSPPRFEGSNNDGGSGGDAGSGSGADQ